MRVSIIVPTLNEESHIVGTIRSLQRLSSEKEIIVVDGQYRSNGFARLCAKRPSVGGAPRAGQCCLSERSDKSRHEAGNDQRYSPG